MRNRTSSSGSCWTKLYVAVVSDVLDAGGLLEQAMDARLRPLAPGMRLVGRATHSDDRRCSMFGRRSHTAHRIERSTLYAGRRHGGLDESLWSGTVFGASSSRRRPWPAARVGALSTVTHEMPNHSLTWGFRFRYRLPTCPLLVALDGRWSWLPGRGWRGSRQPGDIIFGDYDGIVAIPPDRLVDVVTAAHNKVKARTRAVKMLQARRYPPRGLRPVRRALVGDRKRAQHHLYTARPRLHLIGPSPRESDPRDCRRLHTHTPRHRSPLPGATANTRLGDPIRHDPTSLTWDEQMAALEAVDRDIVFNIAADPRRYGEEWDLMYATPTVNDDTGSFRPGVPQQADRVPHGSSPPTIHGHTMRSSEQRAIS